MKYDYLIVGAGFYGSICAYTLNKKGYNVCVIEKRDHIGGNCYTSNKNGINIHEFGPHIFHTSNEEVWNWINQFTEFNNFIYSPVAFYKDKVYSLPFNMWTFSKMWDITTPEQARQIIKEQSGNIQTPTNLEEQAIKLVGTDVYNKLIKGYTEKQWKKSATELPKEIIQRLPVRFTYDNNYFNDKYQGIPINGYTPIFDKLLKDIEVKLNTDFFNDDIPDSKNVIYTGPVDRYFNYKYGELEYKTTEFKHKHINTENYQGTPVMNYTDVDIPYTRIIEHKHFQTVDTDSTWVTWEYPIEYIANKTEPFYPVNDLENNNKYKKYKLESDKLKNTHFGGRLAEYKYYDMDKVILSALSFLKKSFT